MARRPSEPYCPDQGQLIWLEFDPQAGHEQAGRRPALVLSRRIFNQATSFALVCPVTSRVRGYPFEVPLPHGLSVAGVVLADQVRSLSWAARWSSLIGEAPEAVTREVRAKVLALLQ